MKKKKHPTTVRIISNEVVAKLIEVKKKTGLPIERQVDNALKSFFNIVNNQKHL